jgi:hypothetical protein
VELGTSEAQVRRALGTPQAVIRRRVGFGRLFVEWQFDRGAWRVRLLGRRGSLRVTSVATMVRRERTRQGFGVGTQERALRACAPLRPAA